MKIFSKFKDYYDKSLIFGTDPLITYIRNEENITKRLKDQPDIYKKLVKIDNKIVNFYVNEYISKEIHVISKGIVLFCGKIYFYIFISYPDTDTTNDVYTRYGYNTCTEHMYSLDSFKKIISKYAKKDINNNAIKEIEILFSKQGIASEIVHNLHFELDSPIIFIDHQSPHSFTRQTKVYTNPKLRDVEFYKIVNPFIAFQELSMFIGGIMGGKSPIMIQVSDEDRILKHGFDKYSFRKEKKVK